jgi:hypothetical protein
MNYSNCIAIVSLALGLGLSSAASMAQTPAAASDSGFLADYGQLTDARKLRHTYRTYKAPGSGSFKSAKAFLKPVLIFPADSKFIGVDADITAQVLEYVEKKLRVDIAKAVVLVDSSAQADVVIEAALTDISTQAEGKTVLDFTPIGLVKNTVQTAMDGKALQPVLRVELRVSSGDPDKVLLESVHRYAGKGIGRTDKAATRVSFESLVPALNDWVAGTVEELVKP